MIWGDGHSDYGNVFRRFWHMYGHADLDPRTTLIITGDGRNNYRDAGSRCDPSTSGPGRSTGSTLNPAGEWNTTDSIMETYAPSRHGVFEARNLRQLAESVYQIA